MKPSDNQTSRASDSLFAEADVTHSVEAVKLCWEMEKTRRRRLLLRVVLPLLLLLLVGGVYVLARSDVGKQLLNGQFGHSHAGGCCGSDVPADTTTAKPGRFEGYDGAKIKILAVIPGGTPRYEDFNRVLFDAIDNKPSEFHLQLVDLFDLTEESAKELVGAYCTAIVINGQKEFPLPDDQGGTRTVSFMETVNPNLSALDLVAVLNKLHAEQYGPSSKPVVILPEKPQEHDHEAEAVKQDPLPKVVPANHDAEEGGDVDGAVPVIRLTLPTMKAHE